jgi:hypothetical protein
LASDRQAPASEPPAWAARADGDVVRAVTNRRPHVSSAADVMDTASNARGNRRRNNLDKGRALGTGLPL